MSTVYRNDYFLQNLASCTNLWEKVKFSIWTCHMDQNDNFLQNLGTGTNLWKKWNFQSGHVWNVPKWLFPAKSWIGQKFVEKSEIFSLDMHVRCEPKWQFPWKSQFGHLLVERVKLSVWTCLWWTKITISCKIFDQAQICGKVKFSVWTCPRWTEMTMSCIIDPKTVKFQCKLE